MFSLPLTRIQSWKTGPDTQAILRFPTYACAETLSTGVAQYLFLLKSSTYNRSTMVNFFVIHIIHTYHIFPLIMDIFYNKDHVKTRQYRRHKVDILQGEMNKTFVCILLTPTARIKSHSLSTRLYCLSPVVDKSGTSCYHLLTRVMRPTDSQQVVPTSLISGLISYARNKLLRGDFFVCYVTRAQN